MSGSAPSALLGRAVALHQQGLLEQAQALYEQVLAADPRQFDALHLSGVIARQRGDAARAVDLIRAALQVDAHQARAHCNLGAALQDLGQADAALQSYETALRLDPRYALAWNNRGNTLRRLQRLPEALDSYERALAQQSNYPEAWCLRAIVLNDLGRHADAAASAEQALAGRPGYADAQQALGNALQALERFAESVAAYDCALAGAAPGHRAEIWCARGAALKKSGDLARALDSYDHALLLRPGYALAEHYRANVLRALGRREEAVQAYRRARELGADPAGIGFALAALGEGEAPKSAPAGYVKELFDQYAGHFDRHLVGVLGYRTPELLVALLHGGPGAQVGSALDLGCGTGLCAPLLRPLARRLAGVDLSEKMLDKARESGLYDELACADILAWLESRQREWDLVLAADVLVYFGELAPLFARVAQALHPGGRFAFSVEALENEAGYAITASNRFAHAPAYVRACAAQAGFTVVKERDAVLRKEHGADVAGMLFLLHFKSG
ncbi:tetratricopeptide repeat protein [Massilia sp. LXY-6]|uniref:tetratricopeptide repeat protein n=1 Tax=Massilia sp. LXY-6 TaxID=3379823 RepID=UPI003EDECFC6